MNNANYLILSSKFKLNMFMVQKNMKTSIDSFHNFSYFRAFIILIKIPWQKLKE